MPTEWEGNNTLLDLVGSFGPSPELVIIYIDTHFFPGSDALSPSEEERWRNLVNDSFKAIDDVQFGILAVHAFELGYYLARILPKAQDRLKKEQSDIRKKLGREVKLIRGRWLKARAREIAKELWNLDENKNVQPFDMAARVRDALNKELGESKVHTPSEALIKADEWHNFIEGLRKLIPKRSYYEQETKRRDGIAEWVKDIAPKSAKPRRGRPKK